MKLFSRRTPVLCQFCGAAPAIERSHVVPRFVFRYIQKNSPTGELLYSWGRRFEHDQIVGPYLCAHHDNDVFQSWETHYCNHVFPNPLAAGHQWHAGDTVRFALSLCYRYALHHLRVAPHDANAASNAQYRERCRSALDDLGEVGQHVFVYPHVVRPVLASCAFMNRVNSFLALSVHGCVRPLGAGLPEVFIVRIPKTCFVFSLTDLAATPDPRTADLVDLRPGTPFDPGTANGTLLGLLASYVNEGVGETLAHQKSLGWWRKYLIGRDMAAHPGKMAYQAAGWDRTLDEWQRENCPQGE